MTINHRNKIEAVVALFLLHLLAASALVHRVNVTSAQAFSPGLVAITTGDTVVWANEGGSHNVVSDDGLFRCAAGCDATSSSNIVVGEIGNGNASSAAWTFNITFSVAGLYPYYCENFGGPELTGMSGAIYAVDAPVVINRTYNGVISGATFVAIIVGVVGGVILGVVLLVISIATFRNRHAILAPLHRPKH